MPRLRKKNSKRTKVCPELLLPKKLIKTPRKKRVKVDLKKIESLESNQGDYILQFIPSKTTRDDKKLVTKKIDVHTKALKKIDVHTKALKKLITTSFNFVRNYEFLISSAKEVLRLVDCYIKDSKLQPFNYDWLVYDPPREVYKEPNVSAYICNLAKNGHASVHPNFWIDPENVLFIDHHMEPFPLIIHPLNQKESKIWLEFKKLDKGNSVEEEEERSVNLSYPLVGVIGGFAVAAFNKACELIKKVGHNLHDFEYMECKYVKDTEDYLFYMTIEAIEEGNLGVYEAIVVCPRAEVGTCLQLTLLKFVLTDRTPVGAKAMALSLFSCMRSLCQALKDDAEEKAYEIRGIHSSTRGMTRGKACHEMIFLGYFERAVIKGIRRVLYLNLELLFEPDCTRRNDPDDWSILNISWMVPRNNGTPSRGYDYDNYNPYITARSALAKK
uniref:uncharacterized protein LOC122602004 n=1 Tax=Erigeron canadensis TaxID=72917 RepID=UPI001CB89FF1|nr:uncharacterized protein LOC122602004 [Erigeron canadensis]